MAPGALAGGFGLGDIGKAAEAVGKDHPNVLEVVEDRVQLAAADPQKAEAAASSGAHALKVVDTTKAKDAATSAAQNMAEKSPEAAQHALGELFQEGGVEEVASGKVAEAIA